uniref:leucine--tRNA ligase n=1 Tax=Chromera velia CCMP2878 TaxID=1169474 RepID=A0A0G4FH79_9ALVE|mmetsp:Transcript_44327/g.87514  ORF Transcript_44327/g.87514 Transcript_44327/m.87514 type:complete len:1122 (+) Transcript_44327:161-3526(+)|eukprot:Cvel_16973.t1-p1 / transcript=Cvel_16973.t1 / gene=Cvel_16973 / organism=Chromera_velia_CCMP2878 / gene_product=Leucine--tRNA ligase, cytoplasmic, putative / transcript_product=Leucine--tRNA ligase, cytoplasmic, putative / location=Cvel_scaffold1332:36034-43691(+) / protein_length=1121 / sequence_SO=supercontig / SO=protein_coding / is_pseudo=false
MATANSASQPVEAKSFARRDHIRSVEKAMQKLWEEKGAYCVNAPAKWGDKKEDEKFFCTFPYPYMNGRLHLGHAFTMTKAEFQARFQRHLGKTVLWPFGFHCTGMPIAAAADKIRHEIQHKGEKEEETVKESTETPAPPATNGQATEVPPEGGEKKFSGKKSKAVAKGGGKKSQIEIMRSMGVSDAEIPKFADPLHWLEYFPPLGMADLKIFGVAVDWRRSFITTDVNPYYDAFIRWHFNRLKASGKIKFGKRLAIYSTIDGQPCADHDRASGENVVPQEYTLIKMKVQSLESFSDSEKAAVGQRPVFFVAATLRPETMYGQTNCFVLPEGVYGAFVTCSDEVFICSRRSARNMGYQEIAKMEVPEKGARIDARDQPLPEPVCLFEIEGKRLIGAPLSAPNATFPTVYALPMMTISMEKGTGVVTSVPSDAPDDYAALKDLKDKPALREKFGVKEEWVMPFEVVEIIEIPGYGRQPAVKLYEDKKIKSQNDKEKLAEAKGEVYLKGFYEGILLVGQFAGKKVCDAKGLCRTELIQRGEALTYSEPEKPVVSRSGDDCVVALCDQWYLPYGEDPWKTNVEEHVRDPERFNAFAPQALNQFTHTLGWLKDWACSRSYGLGTKLPWDKEVVIESLSDSTIYMAYYTIAHLLQKDLFGKEKGELGLTPDQLTDEVFDFVFCLSDSMPASSSVPPEALEQMRREFSFWYPMNLRVSGKDLIPNHLTMALYNHAAIWEKQPDKWPKGFFSNGHVLVNAEKMSKSAGNFLTVTDVVEQYTADATRLCCADAGDSLEDANFTTETANATILRLWNVEQFAAEVAEGLQKGVYRTGPKTEADSMFEAEVFRLVSECKGAFERMIYRDALKAGFYDFQTARDVYRLHCGPEEMHSECIAMWQEFQMILLSPICPHMCEHIWQSVLKKDGLCVCAPWSVVPEPDPMLLRQRAVLLTSVGDFRAAKDKAVQQLTKKKKGKQADASAAPEKPPELDASVVYVATSYLDFQQTALEMMQQFAIDPQTNDLPKDFISDLKKSETLKSMPGDVVKKILQFAAFQAKEVKIRGAAALELSLPFDEADLLRRHSEFVKRSIGVKDLDIWKASEPHPSDTSDRRTQATPCKPVVHFYSKS